MEYELFKDEKELLEAGQKFLDAAKAGEKDLDAATDAYAVLHKEYKKLLKQSGRLVKMSDRSEERVRDANKELKQALAVLEQTQTELVEAEKMASLGQLVAGVAHEINTPLGIILTAASSLTDQTKSFRGLAEEGKARKSDVFNYFEQADELSNLILNHGQAAADLINSFKRVSVDQSNDIPDRFDLATLVNDTIRSLHPKFSGTAVEVTLDFPHPIEMTSFPGTFVQVLTNLVMNALLHGFEDGRAGTIEIGAMMSEDQTIAMRVSDTGKGIPEDIRDKLFDPFVTTKRGQGGTGLGLNIVFNLIVGKLQGKVSLEDTPGGGATFLLTLPLMIEETKNDEASQ